MSDFAVQVSIAACCTTAGCTRTIAAVLLTSLWYICSCQAMVGSYTKVGVLLMRRV